MNRTLPYFAAVLLLLFIPGRASGQAPQLINFQAQIDEMTLGTASVIFEIYDAPSNGTRLWGETYPSLAITNGRIQVALGSEEAFTPDVFEGTGDRYIQVTINGETLSPRTQLTSTPFSLRAAVADNLSQSAELVTALNSISGDVSLTEGDNVTITPQGQDIRIDAQGDGVGVATLNAISGNVT